MKKIATLSMIVLLAVTNMFACEKCKLYDNNPDLKIKSASVKLNKKFGQLEFEITVEGNAGKTVPKPAGKLDGAPVLGYVFPTSLKSEDVGFGRTEGS